MPSIKKRTTKKQEASAHREHKRYVREYQREMSKLGRRGRLRALLIKMQERVVKYIEAATTWEIEDDEVEGLHLIAEDLDDVIEMLKEDE